MAYDYCDSSAGKKRLLTVLRHALPEFVCSVGSGLMQGNLEDDRRRDLRET